MATEPAPASPEFHQQIVAPQSDVDILGHVSNVAIVRWIQDVAWAHSAAVGLDHANYMELGAVFVVRKHEVEYLRSAYGGETIDMFTHVQWWKAAASERHTRIVRHSDGTLIARARTLWAFVSAATQRPTRIPQQVADAFAQPCGKP
jgi:acyl-CoA thioester hydrolase